jgi:hypothetical protein
VQHGQVGESAWKVKVWVEELSSTETTVSSPGLRHDLRKSDCSCVRYSPHFKGAFHSDEGEGEREGDAFGGRGHSDSASKGDGDVMFVAPVGVVLMVNPLHDGVYL